MGHIKFFWAWVLPLCAENRLGTGCGVRIFSFASVVFNAYVTYLWFDSVTRFAEGTALSYFLLELFDNGDNFVGHIPRTVRFVLVFSCIGTAAIF